MRQFEKVFNEQSEVIKWVFRENPNNVTSYGLLKLVINSEIKTISVRTS